MSPAAGDSPRMPTQPRLTGLLKCRDNQSPLDFTAHLRRPLCPCWVIASAAEDGWVEVKAFLTRVGDGDKTREFNILPARGDPVLQDHDPRWVDGCIDLYVQADRAGCAWQPVRPALLRSEELHRGARGDAATADRRNSPCLPGGGCRHHRNRYVQRHSAVARGVRPPGARSRTEPNGR